MDIPVQVSNATKEIVVQVSDPNTIWLVVVTLVLAGITFFGILLANKRTVESNALTRKELDSKIRAWLRIEMLKGSHIKLSDDFVVPWEEYWHNRTKYSLPIIEYIFDTKVVNIGSLPAIDVKGKFLQNFNKFSREDLEKSQNTKPFPLLPEENFPKTFVLTEKEYQNTSIQTPYYIGLLVEYHVDDKITSKVGKIWEMHGVHISLVDSWI